MTAACQTEAAGQMAGPFSQTEWCTANPRTSGLVLRASAWCRTPGCFHALDHTCSNAMHKPDVNPNPKPYALCAVLRPGTRCRGRCCLTCSPTTCTARRGGGRRALPPTPPRAFCATRASRCLWRCASMRHRLPGEFLSTIAGKVTATAGDNVNRCIAMRARAVPRA